MTMNIFGTTLQDILTCLLLFALIIFVTGLTAVFILIDCTTAFTSLEVVRTRLGAYKAQIQEMDVESSVMKAKLDVMLRNWKEDIIKQTRNQHASVCVGEWEASRLRTAVECSCVQIEPGRV
ncbi:hypothetical protein BDZ94DRAFT_1266400, partial [Collybia nuda]